MIISTLILGWIGILIYLLIIFTYRKIVSKKEFAFLHALMVLMYVMWLPIPIALNQLLDSDVVQIGTLFGLVYLILLVISFVLQTGHLTYIAKYNNSKAITDKHADYMMSLLSNPFESLSNILRCIWGIFLAITFWQEGDLIMAGTMFIFSLFVVYYLIMMVNTSLIKRIKLLSKFKSNFVLTNLETLFFFIVLLSYMTQNI